MNMFTWYWHHRLEQIHHKKSQLFLWESLRMKHKADRFWASYCRLKEEGQNVRKERAHFYESKEHYFRSAELKRRGAYHRRQYEDHADALGHQLVLHPLAHRDGSKLQTVLTEHEKQLEHLRGEVARVRGRLDDGKEPVVGDQGDQQDPTPKKRGRDGNVPGNGHAQHAAK